MQSLAKVRTEPSVTVIPEHMQSLAKVRTEPAVTVIPEHIQSLAKVRTHAVTSQGENTCSR